MKVCDRIIYTETNHANMSNLDHSIDIEAENVLRSGKFIGDYAAWDFHGDTWFEDGKFYCEIRRYHRYIDTIGADSLQEIMDIASQRYGEE